VRVLVKSAHIVTSAVVFDERILQRMHRYGIKGLRVGVATKTLGL